MTMMRWLRHLTLTRWHLRRAFPESTLQAVTAMVAESEQTHGGEIRVAIEGDWPLIALWRGVTARQRAIQVFNQLQVGNTQSHNGVLIYLNLAERDVEIVADPGLDPWITTTEWDGVCRTMEVALAKGDFETAVCAAVRQVGALLARTFPAKDRNEQSDRPVLL